MKSMMVLRRCIFITVFIGFLLINSDSLVALESSQSVQLTMEQAIERALQYNNQIKAGQYGLKKASWSQTNALTRFFPQINLNSRMIRIDDRTFAERDFRRYLPPSLRDQIPQTVFQESYYTSVDVTVPVFNAALWNGWTLARANKRMAKALSLSTQQNIIFQVIRSYLNVIKAQATLELQKEFKDLSNQNLEKAKRLASGGRYSEADVLRWRIDFEQQLMTVIEEESHLRNSRSLLNKLLNIEISKMIHPQKSIPESIKHESEKLMSVEDTTILALVNLPESRLIQVNAALQAIQESRTALKIEYRNTAVSYLPTLSASYSYGWRENNTLALDDYSPNTFMINMRIPLFNSFQTLSTVKSSYYAYKENEELFYDQLKEIQYIITNTANRLITLKARRIMAETNVEYANTNYHIAKTQKEKGLVSNLEFVDAKLNLQNAKLNKVNTEYDFFTTMVELYYLLGKLDIFVPK